VRNSGNKPVSPVQKNQIIDFIGSSREGIGIRNIMIGIGTKDREGVKQAVKELQQSGAVERIQGKKYVLPGRLPRITVIVVIGTDEFGEAIAEPLSWNYNSTPPLIYIKTDKRHKTRQSALGKGDRALARLEPFQENSYTASVIKKIGSAPGTVLGIYREHSTGSVIEPTERKYRSNFTITPGNEIKARTGDLVKARIEPRKKYQNGTATIIEVLYSNTGTNSKENQLYSQIALHSHNIPHIFNDRTNEQAAKAKSVPLGKRRDLREIPLVTIDDEDARDFDDAVFAEPDSDKGNPGGWHIIVAIADVAWYVQTGDHLDKTALERGNSVYFPDQVIPMLPEPLSNHWCSLKPNKERPCLAVHIWIDTNGQTLRHKFVRGLMKSHARLNYSQVQAAADGSPDSITVPLLRNVIKPLYGAYEALCQKRQEREPLDLDLPEKKIVLNENGTIQSVQTRIRHDSHKLIEEFMITANVAAAKTLEKQKQRCLYRVHDEPPAKNLESYRTFLKTIGFKLSKGQVLIPRNFNQILRQAKDSDFFDAISQMTLRSQSQAIYTSKNFGHFGLALRQYCHFTSPIRRYADLVIHRLLISALESSPGGFNDDPPDIEVIGQHLCVTERRAAIAERDVIDRFSAAYLTNKIGKVFNGKVSGVTKFGLFVTLDEIAADGLVPIRSLPNDFYKFDEKRILLKGSRNKKVFHLGMKIDVILKEANPISGSLVLTIDNPTGTNLRTKRKNKNIYP